LISFIIVYSNICLAENRKCLILNTIIPQKINLIAGKSLIVESPVVLKRVSVADPEISDVIVISTRQIYINAKTPGTTNITLWGPDNKVASIMDLVVSSDIQRLKEKLYEVLPDEQNILVASSNDHIILSGIVKDTISLSNVLALAEPYAPEKVINLMQVGGVHQVMLEVRVAEISRTMMKKLGFNFNYISSSGNNLGVSMLSALTSLPASGWPGAPIEVSSSINAIFRFFSDGVPWTVFIDALKENHLLKVLAEPTLITLSGQDASFLAGGEFPIPVPQGDNGITIDYKKFGVSLNFTPTVLSDKKIVIDVSPEVSELDFSNSVTIGGYVIPSLTTRRVSTSIELADSQSFAIAGLLKDDVRQVVSKFPILGSIPVLGALFRSSSFQKNETELVIIVTPHLVTPLLGAEHPLPTDQYVEPNDFEFYFLGRLEGHGKSVNRKNSNSSINCDQKHGMEGEFGYIIP